MSRNLDTIQTIYQAFGQGDIPGILARIAPDAQWEHWSDHSAQRAGHPSFAARGGPQGAGEFFQTLAHVEVHEFRVLDMLGEGRQVAVEVLIDFTWKPTGRRVRDEELHLWTFNADGRVSRMRHYVDTHKHLVAAGLAGQ